MVELLICLIKNMKWFMVIKLLDESIILWEVIIFKVDIVFCLIVLIFDLGVGGLFVY